MVTEDSVVYGLGLFLSSLFFGSTCVLFMYWKYLHLHRFCLRPYHVEITSSRLITEVKQYWAELVLGWVTAWEYSVL